MVSKYFGLLLGVATTLAISAFSWAYLKHKKYRLDQQTIHPVYDFVETMDHRFNDVKYRWQNATVTKAPVVLVAIDDASVQEVGRWPWGRDVIANLFDELLRYDVATVGLDIIFSEPELGEGVNDQRLGKIINAHKEKIILGTFSNNKVDLLPYQDYCVTEAFLATGGDQLVKINPSLVVDDELDLFEDVQWDQVFSIVFADIIRNEKQNYLNYLGKKSDSELNKYQKNRMMALLQTAQFAYCTEWLTDHDRYGKDRELQRRYAKILKEKFPELGSDIRAKLKQFKQSSALHPTPQYGEWVSNISLLQEPAEFTASFVAQLDVDGYVRRYPLFYRSGNKLGTSYIPSLALQMYLQATHYRADVTLSKPNGYKAITQFKIVDAAQDPEKIVHDLPIDAQGQMLLHYYGPQNTLSYVSAKDLLNENDTVGVMVRVQNAHSKNIEIRETRVSKKEFFKNKAVLIGATSNGIYDLRNTPIEANYPGPELHLTMLANLFDGKFYYQLTGEEIKIPAIIFITGLLLSFALSFMGSLTSLASFVLCLGFGSAVDFYLFSTKHILMSSFMIFSLIFCIHFVMIVYKYFSEERKKRELKKTFSKYVSPAVVEEILKKEENLKLGGRKQEMSVFFSDVRGFTEFSEKMDPEDLSQFLNNYLTPMTEIIFNNKGTLDKYMGDGLMAFFGAPVAFNEHAYYACKSALESIDKLQQLKVDFAKRNWPNIEIGIGINTGIMSVGNMGSQIVQSYTVIGDAVNLGSRLEGATKQYGARILVSEATYEATKNFFLFREVDRVRVKGKQQPVGAFELLSEHKKSTDKEYVEKYQQAYSAYLQRNFTGALKLYTILEQEYPNDLLIRIYKKRCIEFIQSPPEDSWDGVYEMKSK
ncbi:MAG: adenylate/guanylate cyclase domain-containing protein [Bdellovibrionaceae bacterium]|nr:adenylate/guanylate cyclase domain-containing protein [Pseudobdellovibrionaceae bacterium]